jgi:hypothetical protein
MSATRFSTRNDRQGDAICGSLNRVQGLGTSRNRSAVGARHAGECDGLGQNSPAWRAPTALLSRLIQRFPG